MQTRIGVRGGGGGGGGGGDNSEWKRAKRTSRLSKSYSTSDHLQALNQIIEKSNEYKLPLCICFIDYEKAFDTVEHVAIFEALRKTSINETYVKKKKSTATLQQIFI